MKIQWIGSRFNRANDIDCTSIDKPNAFDRYDINVLDLSSPFIWYYIGEACVNINCAQDLINIREMLQNSQNKQIVVILPQDITFYYYYYIDEYRKSAQIKNILPKIINILNRNIFLPFVSLGYENNITKLNEETYTSAFYFKQNDNIDSGENIENITTSLDSNKVTTIKIDNYYITTLKIGSEKSFLTYLQEIKLLCKEEKIPDWLIDYRFNDDEELKNDKIQSEKELVIINEKIKEINNRIITNEGYKRILIETGDSLVNIVFNILNQIFNINLYDFKDKKAEDFVFTYNETTFIGEIKGINSNVKKANISQLDDHYCNYIDDKTEEEIKKIKPLLIITHQRLKSLCDRQPVADAEIKKAENNNALIIEGETLLKIYEQYCKNSLSTDDIYNLFLDKGLLKI